MADDDLPQEALDDVERFVNDLLGQSGAATAGARTRARRLLRDIYPTIRTHVLENPAVRITPDRKNDLPVAWDGRKVEWSPWMPPKATTLDFHLPVEVCGKCGSRRRPSSSMGTLAPPSGAKLSNGRPAYPVRALCAYRCADCYHDIVCGTTTWYGIRRGECWDLDASDYGTMGSTDVSAPSGGTQA